MKTHTVLLCTFALLLLGGCDTATPEPSAGPPLPDLEAASAAYDGLPGRLHRITYSVSDGDGASPHPEARARRHGAQVQGEASILYTTAQGLVRLDDATLPWQNTVRLPSGTPVELHVLYGPVRDTLLVHIYQDDVLLKAKSRAAPGGAFAFARVQ